MPTRRLFFALWPDDAIRQAIIERRERLGAISRKRVPDHNLHLTLAFLGNRPAGQVQAIEEAAGAGRAEFFELVLDRFGYFPRAGVVWLGGEAPEPASGLAAGLGEAMRALNIRLEERPFRPHVTLFRKVGRRPQMPDPPPLNWPVREFVLVESLPGRPYQVLRSWSLQSGSGR